MYQDSFRVHSHAAAALVNFCSGATKEAVTPYLDNIIKGLLSMLNSSTKAYVQQQSLTTMAMVADAAQSSFRKVTVGVAGRCGIVLTPRPCHLSSIRPSSQSFWLCSVMPRDRTKGSFAVGRWNAEDSSVGTSLTSRGKANATSYCSCCCREKDVQA